MSSEDDSTITSEQASTIGLLPNGNKALFDYNVDKRNFCEENWYDWFTVPNYHLGNNFAAKKEDNSTTCYAQCPTYSVPAFGTDPNDGESQSLLDRSDKIDKCVTRDTYFSGKYATGSDFCPLTKIHQIHNSVRNDLKDYVEKKYPQENIAFITTPESKDTVDQASRLKTLETSIQNNEINPTFEELNEVHNSKEYQGALTAQIGSVVSKLQQPIDVAEVRPPGYAEMVNACNSLNTRERATEAYAICHKLHEMESIENETERASVQSSLFNNDTNRMNMMKQACHAVFCNDKSTASTYVEGETVEPTCFPNVGLDEIEQDYSPPIPEEEKFGMLSAPFRSFATALGLILMFFVFLFLYACYNNRYFVIELCLRIWIPFWLGIPWGQVYDLRDEFLRQVQAAVDQLKDELESSK